MKKHQITTCAAGFCLTLLSGLVFAAATTPANQTATPTTPVPVTRPVTVVVNTQPAQPFQLSAIIQKLQGRGYFIFRKIELEDGAYSVEAINMQGDEEKLKINPQNGDIFEPKVNTTRITMLDAVRKVEATGYHNIYKVMSDGDVYDVKALNKDGKKVSLEVNAITSEISKNWF